MASHSSHGAPSSIVRPVAASAGGWIGTVWVDEELVPQVEMTADATVVVDPALLQLLGSLRRRELDALSRAVAGLDADLMLSTDAAELRALRQAPDASDFVHRAIDGEVRLVPPQSGGTADRLVRGLSTQLAEAPLRWRPDVAAALFTLLCDLEDAARRRRQRLVLGSLAAAGGAVALVRLVLGRRAPARPL